MAIKSVFLQPRAPSREVLEDIPDTLENLHLTCVTPDGASTFARDNARGFEGWMLLQCAKLYNDERGWNAVLMIKREFTHLKDAASGLPVKKYHLADWRKTEA